MGEMGVSGAVTEPSRGLDWCPREPRQLPPVPTPRFPGPHGNPLQWVIRGAADREGGSYLVEQPLLRRTELVLGQRAGFTQHRKALQLGDEVVLWIGVGRIR